LADCERKIINFLDSNYRQNNWNIRKELRGTAEWSYQKFAEPLQSQLKEWKELAELWIKEADLRAKELKELREENEILKNRNSKLASQQLSDMEEIERLKAGEEKRIRWVKPASKELPQHMVKCNIKIEGDPYSGYYDYSRKRWMCPNLGPQGIDPAIVEWLEETEQQPEGKVLRIGKIDLWGIFSDHAKETGKEFTAMEKNHIVELFDRVYKFQSKLLQPQVEEGKPPFFCEQWQMNQDLLLKHRREPCKAQCDYCNPFKESQVEEGNKEKEEK
jgi:hypothetical protein